MDNNETSSTGRVECPARPDAATRPLLIAAIFIGFGLYCFTDWGNEKYAPPEAWTMEHINQIGNHVLTYYGPFVLIPIGLISLVVAIRILRRKIVADATGVGAPGKQVPWSAVKKLDASQLKDKQILKLQHGQGEELVLDGFNIKNFKELVAFVESHIPDAAKSAPAPTQADDASTDQEQKPEN